MPSHAPIVAPDTRRPWGLIALALCLWFVSSFFLLGNLGRWLDDYAWTHRDFVTGTWSWSNVLARPYHSSWRLLMNWTVMNAQTILWDRPWANHLLSASLHGLACLALFRLARAWGCGRGAAFIACALMLSLPIAHEAVLWPAALGVVPGTLTLLLIARRVSLMGVNPPRPRTWGTLALASASLPLWYEQPTAVLAAVPILALAGVAPGASLRARLTRAAQVAALCGLSSLAVLLFIHSHRHPGDRGSIESFTTLAELPAKIVWTSDYIRGQMLMREFARGAVIEGWSCLQRFPARALAVALIAALAVLSAARPWLRAHMHRPITPERAARADLRWCALAFCLVGFTLSWAPIIAVKTQGVAARLCYTPTALLLLLAALLLHALLAPRPGDAIDPQRPLPPRPWRGVIRAIAGLLALAACSLGAVGMVGVQSAMQKRFRADERQARDLLEAIPNPAPDSVFIPAGYYDRVVNTGDFMFDVFPWAVWETSYSAPLRIHDAYRRRDLHFLSYNRWEPVPITRASARGIELADTVYLSPAFGKRNSGPQFVPWDKVIPIRFDSDGRARPVSRVLLELPDNSDRLLDLPHVRDARATLAPPIKRTRGRGPWRLRSQELAPGQRFLDCWNFDPALPTATRDCNADFHPLTIWRATRTAVELHPDIPLIPGRDRIYTTLPARAAGTASEGGGAHDTLAPRRIHLRASLQEYAVTRKLGDGVTLILEIARPNDAARTELSRTTIAPRAQRKVRKWLPIDAVIPSEFDSAGASLFIRVEPGPANNPDYDTLCISMPVLEDDPR